MSELYPFSAIVGMDLAKTSLLLHAVNPRLGGVLLSGHRGCAKTTLARAFAALLPECAACELPLGASEDRLLGSVDVAAVLERNEWAHQAGLLEQADGGMLYVDEVNLLPDALADQLLDASATGSYQLEREGMSRRIESRFILLGSMNPEEGTLRPQLADRFAHTIEITTDSGVDNRASIIERRLSFESNPDLFQEEYVADEQALRQSIEQARLIISEVKLSKELTVQIAQSAESRSMEGMRGGLAVAKTALAAAAWEGRRVVSGEDVDLAWLLCTGQQQNMQTDSSQKPDSHESEGKSEASPRSFVSLQPRGAQQDAISQTAAGEVMEELLKPLLSRDPVSALNNKAVPSSGPALIHWKDTVLGWVRDARRERLRRFDRRQKRNLWVFLDASRSSGAENFLERALALLRQTLGSAGLHGVRVHVLQLSHGQLQWLGKDLMPASASKLLSQPFVSAGSSILGEAFMELLQDARRRGAGPGDSLVVLGDGIATIAEGESQQTVQEVMKRHLSRVARMGAQLAWCAPQVKRGFLHPVDTLVIRPICGAASI